MPAGSPNDAGDKKVPLPGSSPSVVGSERERDLVSRFGWIDSAVLSYLDVSGG